MASAIREEHPGSAQDQVIHERNLGFIQRDFINPKNLGFMKVILFFFGLNILFNGIGMAVTTKDAYVFTFANVLNLLNIIFDAVSFWLIWRRKKVARWWVIGFAAFNIIVGTIYNVFTGEFYWVGQLVSSFTDIILILYFLIAKRVKICLDQPFSLAAYEREDKADRECFQPRTWPFWRNLIIYFCVFSVVGHWMEAGYCTLIRFGIIPGIYDPNSGIWSDFLSPFLVYGFGVVACVLIFYPLKLALQKRLSKGWQGNFIAVFITFVVAGIVCCMIELAMGLMMNMNYELWDYRDMFCNFMGQICLQNGIAFGMVATLMTWIIYPALEGVMDRLPREIGNGLLIAVVVFFALIWLLYCFQPSAETEEFLENVAAEEETDDTYANMNEVTLLLYAQMQAESASAAADNVLTFLEANELPSAKDAAQTAKEAADDAQGAIDAYWALTEDADGAEAGVAAEVEVAAETGANADASAAATENGA